MARAAGLQICGGNGMGFYNLEHSLRVCGFPPPPWLERGSIALISHSGSAFSGLCHTDRRFRFQPGGVAGQELVTTVATTWTSRLICRRLASSASSSNRARSRWLRRRTGEGAPARHSHRRPEGRAHRRERRPRAQPFRRAGRQPCAYQALFDRYGVIEVDDLDGLANCLLLFCQPRRAGKGGLATMHDSAACGSW